MPLPFDIILLLGRTLLFEEQELLVDVNAQRGLPVIGHG